MNESNSKNDFGAELMQLIEENLNLQQWNFRLSHTSLGDIDGIPFRRIIYDSEWCRIRFSYSRRALPDEHELNIYYGRLHASSDESFMMWKGEKCWCWHSNRMALFFLDDLSPSDALMQKKNEKHPAVLEKFWKSDLNKRLKQESGAKIGIIKHSIIWEHYGGRLFELFDLRHPALWDQYADFLKEYYAREEEYYKLKGIAHLSMDPPRYKVC